MNRIWRVCGIYLVLTAISVPVQLLYAFTYHSFPQSGLGWACFILLAAPIALVCDYIFGTYWSNRWTRPIDLIAERISSSPWRLVLIIVALVIALMLSLMLCFWMELYVL